MRERVSGNLTTVAGCGFDTMTAERWKSIEVAREADVIVLALGEESAMSGEGGSRTDITLPEVRSSWLST